MVKDRIFLLGYPVFSQELSRIDLTTSRIINTINGHSYSVAKNDLGFSQALKRSDILLADGSSIVFGVKVLHKKKIKKIAGYDIFIHLLKLLNEKSGSCFFLGSSNTTLTKIVERLDEDYPNVRVGTFSPQYKQNFSEEDSLQMNKAVNDFSPAVLFIGMTAPKQEMWVDLNKEKLNASIICSIGAVFDFYAGTTNRPPQWMINIHLEWLGRLLKEPKRMWKRYLLSTPVFFIDLFLEKTGLLKHNR